MKKINMVLLNAFIVAAIVFFSTVGTEYPPHVQDVYSAMIGFFLALLTQLKTITGGTEPPKMGMLI